MRIEAWFVCLGLLAQGCADDSSDAAADDGGSFSGEGQGEAGDEGNDGGGSGSTTAGSTGGGDDGPPPEDEDMADFRVPKASGRFVYSASENTNEVAVIDSSDLSIDVVAVGRGPTVVQPIDVADPEGGAVVALCQGSSEVAILRTAADQSSEIELRDVTQGANNLAVSPAGDYVVVYHDIDGPETLGPGSDQEITVLETVAGGSNYEMSVGSHPRDVTFSPTAPLAFVVTDDGVNVVELSMLGMVGKPRLVPVTVDQGLDPALVEIHVAASRSQALARMDGERWVTVTDLTTGAITKLELPGIATDLDLAADDSYALAMLPNVTGSALAEIPLPLNASGPFTIHTLDREYVGLANLVPDGNAAILYTTVNPFAQRQAARVGRSAAELQATGTDGTDTGTDGTGTSATEGSESGGETQTSETGSSSEGTDTGSASEADTGTESSTAGDSGSDDSGSEAGETSGDSGDEPPIGDPRKRVTIVRRTPSGWTDQVTIFVEVPVRAVGVAPDSANAILLQQANAQLNQNAPWPYTLLDLTSPFPIEKTQNVEAEPDSILFTPDGTRAAVLLRDVDPPVQRLDFVNLRNFIVSAIPLGSPPDGAGFVHATEKIFVSQQHPAGRITFIASDGRIETVTGYQLNDSVKD